LQPSEAASKCSEFIAACRVQDGMEEKPFEHAPAFFMRPPVFYSAWNMIAR
jgi:hypothetical protein